MLSAAVFHYVRFARHLFRASVLGGIAACVTIITDGFDAEPSDEEFPGKFIQLAVAYFDAGDMPYALRHRNKALEIGPRNSEAFKVLAQISPREGNLKLATAKLQRAVRLNQENLRARNNYAALPFLMEDYEDAYFMRALTLNSIMSALSIELALLDMQRGSWPGARQVSRQFLTTTEFYSLPHIPRALLAGIPKESRFNNHKLVDDFTRIPTSRSQEFSEYAEL